MLVSIPPKLAVADFMGYLKGKSTLMIFERHANLKYKYGRRVFKEYEDPFKNVADFDDDDSPEVPTDSMRK